MCGSGDSGIGRDYDGGIGDTRTATAVPTRPALDALADRGVESAALQTRQRRPQIAGRAVVVLSAVERILSKANGGLAEWPATLGTADVLLLHADVAVEIRNVGLALERPECTGWRAHVKHTAVVRVPDQTNAFTAEGALEAALGDRAERSTRIRRISRFAVTRLGVEFHPVFARQWSVCWASVSQAEVITSAVHRVGNEGLVSSALWLAGFLARCDVALEGLWMEMKIDSFSKQYASFRPCFTSVCIKRHGNIHGSSHVIIFSEILKLLVI